ncbi:MAG TPA: hypothetical protein VK153_02385 [Candidatus Paceibacterota bacterium]|nr:hypothetical protein [Candidatus Paceibacterota bacterium]
MEHIPAGFLRWSTASTYLYDIERILQELDMARSFVEKLPEEDFLKQYSINPEDYIMYSQGYFLDLIHQLKDKLARLLYAIIVANNTYSRKEETYQKPLTKLKKGKLVIKIPGLIKLLEVWDSYQESDPNKIKNPITIALSKRTDYHHHKNPLTHEENYFQAKTHRTLLSPEMLLHWSDKGKIMIEERGKSKVEALHADSLRKMNETLDAVKSNINEISKIIVNYFKLPLQDSVGRKIMLQYMPLEQEVEIPSCPRTIQNIKDIFQDLFNLMYKSINEAFPGEVVSLYATGSSTREDFMFNISDINIVLVIKSKEDNIRENIRLFAINPPIPIHLPLELTIITESQFKSEECEKIRFICKTDGILIGGVDLLKNEKDFRKSYKVVWMLNKDFKERFLKIKEWALSQTITGPHRQYADVTRDLAKRGFRLCFGQIIGNNAVYATSYKDMKYLMDFYMPENKKLINRLYNVITHRLIVDKDGLLGMIEGYEKNLIPLFNAIDKGVNG